MTTTIDTTEFEKAFRLECVQRAATRGLVHPTINPFTHGDEFAVRYGPFLVDIAKRAGCSIPMARRRMKALQDNGRVLRDDTAGGRTCWWLAGLSAELRPAAPSAPTPVVTPSRQTVTSAAIPVRQHWSDVLGVPRDASTSEVRKARDRALSVVNAHDLDAPAQRERIRAAYSECLKDDNLSEYE